MFKLKIYAIALCLLAAACSKPDDVLPGAGMPAGNNPATQLPQGQDTLIIPSPLPEDSSGNSGEEEDTLTGFTRYTILAGAQYSLQNGFESISVDSIVYDVYFDSSAIYTLANKENQADVNKLFGFTDCGSLQHANSARFGWRYYKNKLELFAYCYANSAREIKSMGAIEVGKLYSCTIVSKPGKYIFYLDGQNPVEMKRGCNSASSRFRLYPYFGGDEVAPHEVNIWLKRRN